MKKNQLALLSLAVLAGLSTNALASQGNSDVGTHKGTNCPSLTNQSPIVKEIFESGMALDQQTRTLNGLVWHIKVGEPGSDKVSLPTGEMALEPMHKMHFKKVNGICSYLIFVDNSKLPSSEQHLYTQFSFTLTPE